MLKDFTLPNFEAIKSDIDRNPLNITKHSGALNEAMSRMECPDWVFEELVKLNSPWALCAAAATLETVRQVGFHDHLLSDTRSLEYLRLGAELGYLEVLKNPLFNKDLLAVAHPYIAIACDYTTPDIHEALCRHPDPAVRFRMADKASGQWFISDDCLPVAVRAAWKSQQYDFHAHPEPMVQAMLNVMHLQPCNTTDYWNTRDFPEVKENVNATPDLIKLSAYLEREVIAEMLLTPVPDQPLMYAVETLCKKLDAKTAALRQKGHDLINVVETDLPALVRLLLQKLGITRVAAASSFEDDESILSYCEYWKSDAEIPFSQLKTLVNTDQRFEVLRKNFDHEMEMLWLWKSDGCHIDYDVETDTHQSANHI
jgi:hypothetical protein